jgi:hypothetical protein
MAARLALALSQLLVVLLSSSASLASAAASSSSSSSSASASAASAAAPAPAAFLFSECLPRFGYRAGALDCGTCAIIARALREGGPSSSLSSSSSASSSAAAAAAVAAEEAACRACCSPTVGLRSSRRFARARIELPPRSALSMFMRAQGGGGDANDNPLGAPPGVKEWLEKAMYRWEGQVEVVNAAAGAGGAPDLASMMAGGLGGMGGPKGETTLTLLTDEEAEGVVAAGATGSEAAGSDSVVTITSWKWEVIEAFLNKKLLRRDD